MRRLGLTLALLLAMAAPAHATPFCRTPVARAVWSQEAQGARIKVFPTGCGRRTAWLAPRAVFRIALALGGRSARHRRSLFAQFRCHAVFAPFKPSWNLETWRPLVSPKQLVAALCNPTGRTAPSSLIGRLVRAIQASVKRTVPDAGSAVSSLTRTS